MQPESRLQVSHSSLIQTLHLYQRHLQPMSLCQSGCYPLSQCYVACFNAIQTLQLIWWHRWCWSFKPVSQSWISEYCLSFWLFFLPLISKMNFMRRREGLIKESRGVIIKHWRSLLCITEPFQLLQDTVEAVIWASMVLVCPAGE